MTYTPKQRQAIANTFKEAKKRLWDGKEKKTEYKRTYICFALDDIARTKSIRTVAIAARTIINQRLGKSYSLGGWLCMRGFSTEHDLAALQTHRHQWLDLLIKEFSK